MVNIELYEICSLENITTFINTEDGDLVAMVEGELNQYPDVLEWWVLWYFGISKYVTGCGIINGKGRGIFSTGDPVEEYEVKMESIACMKVLYGNIGHSDIGFKAL